MAPARTLVIRSSATKSAAETEKNYIRQRQREGIASARARGVKFGRPEKAKPVEYEKVHGLWWRDIGT